MKREPKKSIPLSIRELRWKQVLKWEGEPVLTLLLRRPVLSEDTQGLRRVSRYYRQLSDQWKTRWETALYRDACSAAKASQAQCQIAHNARPWNAELDYTITLNQEGLLSIFQDAYEYVGGVHGVVVRHGDTWQPHSGTPRTLRSFFPPRAHWKKIILAELERQAAARVAGGETLYYDDWRALLIKKFEPDRFYLTEAGICIFYPLYAIAPYAEGIPVFTIPYPAPEKSQEKS